MSSKDGVRGMSQTNMVTMTRVCCTCHVEKTLGNYGRDKRRHLGLDTVCKDCRGRIRQAASYRIMHQQSVRQYYQKNPKKVTAHSLSSRYRKTLLKEKCERCGSTERLELHHPNYDLPLLVRTLCKSCHEVIHHAQE